MLSILSPGILLLSIVYLSFIDKLAFNFGLGQNGHYELLALCSLALATYTLTSLPNFQQQSGRIIICSLLVTCCCLDSSNEYLNTVSIMLILSILVCGASTKSLLPWFFYGNLLFLLIQVSIALYQYCQGDPMTGSLDNTGILANCLSTSVPSLFVAFRLTQPVKKHVFSLFFFFLFGIVLFIVIGNRARTALVSLALTTALLGFHYARNCYTTHGQQLPVRFRVIYLSGIALCIVSIMLYSSSIKQQSSAGRLLMNRIAVQHLGDHFWLGTGLGRFTWFYPQWQANYFLNHPDDPLWLSAGESYIIFNEYLQLVETIGFPGMLLFLGILGWFFTTRPAKGRSELFVIKVTVLAILITGITFYPFHINIILFFFFRGIGLAFSLDQRKMPSLFKSWFGTRLRKTAAGFTIPALMVSLSAFIFSVPGILLRQRSVGVWHRLKESNNDYALQKIGYGKLYPVLKQDGKFLSDFGIFMLEDTLETYRAVLLLRASEERFISGETIMALGNAYWQQDHRMQAIRCFEFMSCYIPYLFEPKFNLMKLYLQSGDSSRARQMAESIMRMPPKILSDKVIYIKQETARLLATILKSP